VQAVIDCIPCYLKQAVNCLSVAGVNQEKQYGILYGLMDDVRRLIFPTKSYTTMEFYDH